MKKKAKKKKTASQVGRMSRQKGAAYELRIAKKLSLWWTDGISKKAFRRTPMSGGWDRRFAAGDLIAPEPDFPVHIEIRKRELFDIGGFLKQTASLKWWRHGKTEAGKKALWYIMSRNCEVDYLIMDCQSASAGPLAPYYEYKGEIEHLRIYLLDEYLAAVSPGIFRVAFNFNIKPEIKRSKSK